LFFTRLWFLRTTLETKIQGIALVRTYPFAFFASQACGLLVASLLAFFCGAKNATEAMGYAHLLLSPPAASYRCVAFLLRKPKAASLFFATQKKRQRSLNKHASVAKKAKNANPADTFNWLLHRLALFYCFASCMLASHASKEAMKQALLFFATLAEGGKYKRWATPLLAIASLLACEASMQEAKQFVAFVFFALLASLRRR
jgi:hypothetical protein